MNWSKIYILVVVFFVVVQLNYSCTATTSLFMTKTNITERIVIGTSPQSVDPNQLGVWLMTGDTATYGPNYINLFSHLEKAIIKDSILIGFSDNYFFAYDLKHTSDPYNYIKSKDKNKVEDFLGYEISKTDNLDTLPLSKYRKNFVQRYLDKSW